MFAWIEMEIVFYCPRRAAREFGRCYRP